MHSAWEAISSPPRFAKRDSARSFEDYASANFGSGRGKLLKTDSAKSDGPANNFDPSHIVGWQRSWTDFFLCRGPRRKAGGRKTLALHSRQFVAHPLRHILHEHLYVELGCERPPSSARRKALRLAQCYLQVAKSPTMSAPNLWQYRKHPELTVQHQLPFHAST